MEIFVARQPIFDVRQQVVGYELLYRRDSRANGGGNGNGEDMSSSLIVDAVLGIGLGNVTDGRTAFINLTTDMLLAGVVDVLDPAKVVLELLESVRPEDRVVEACRELTSRGYRLALDDFVYEPAYDPLLELTEFVKVDVLAHPGDQLADVREGLRPFAVKLLAEKVESKEQHARCVELGFELFQGFHYFRPETLSRQDLSTESVAMLRLLNLLQDMNATDQAINEAFKSDPSLSYKLLRMVNSASLGGRGIDSVGHALRLMGREPLHRWLSLLLVSAQGSAGNIRGELVKSALLRGRLCELIGQSIPGGGAVRMPSAGALFLMGLFSHLETLLGTPMEEILSQIDLTDDIRAALLERDGPGGRVLVGVEAYEEAEWEAAEVEIQGLGGDPGILSELYLDAVAWAGNRMGIHEE